jgi:hypothetical protein
MLNIHTYMAVLGLKEVAAGVGGMPCRADGSLNVEGHTKMGGDNVDRHIMRTFRHSEGLTGPRPMLTLCESGANSPRG